MFDSVHQSGGVIFTGQHRFIDQGRAAKQLDCLVRVSIREQKLFGMKNPQCAICSEFSGRDPLLGEKPLRCPFETQVGCNHLHWRKSGNCIAKRNFHANDTANAIEELPGKPLRIHIPESLGDAGLDSFARLRINVSTQVAQGNVACPARASSQPVPADTEPGVFGRAGSRIQGSSDLVCEVWPRVSVFSGRASSNDWMISATNSERPLTPAFA